MFSQKTLSRKEKVLKINSPIEKPNPTSKEEEIVWEKVEFKEIFLKIKNNLKNSSIKAKKAKNTIDPMSSRRETSLCVIINKKVSKMRTTNDARSPSQKGDDGFFINFATLNQL
jgi:hypothetical protein